MTRIIIASLFSVMVASGDRVSPPIEFEPNVGQAPRDVSFQGHSHGCQIKLLKAAATDIACGDVRLSMLFQGSLSSVPVAEGLLPGTSNYFSGANPKEWRTNIPNYSRVRYPDLYQHIDVVYRANHDWLEYDLEVEPGGDPGRIQIRFPGSRRVSVDQAGNLIVATAAGTMRLPPPHIYQSLSTIAGKYRVSSGTVSFQLGAYDHHQVLVIDPVLTWASYFGSSQQEPWATAIDSAGNVYIAGGRTASSGAGDLNIFVAKLSADGTTTLFTAELGGSKDDQAYGLAVDSSNSVYLAGYTASPDFPVSGTSQNLRGQGTDAFFLKLDPAGQNIVYSNYLGGSGSDVAYGAALDGSGNLWIAGGTQSTDFFTTPNAFQHVAGGAIDAFVTRVSASGQATYSTYFGGSANDTAFAIATGPDSTVYLAGATASTNFPVAGAYQATIAGDTDGFVARFSTAGAPVWSTYAGGKMASCSGCTADDFLQGITVDSGGAAYVTGYTGSLDFPMLNALQSAYGGGTSDAVALKFTAAGTLAWSTYLGGNGADVGVGIAVDGAGGAYVTGNTSSTNFPIVNSFQSTYHGAGDAFVSGFTAAGNMLSYSSYFGGSGAETAHAIAVQCAVGTVIAGKTASSDLPVTARVVQSSLQGASAGFVARIAAGTSVPSITSGGVVNSATFTAPVAPGSLISVFGKNLAAATATPSGSLTTNLGGASVMITGNGGASGFAAPVLYSSTGQLNVQLPFEITSGTASIVANSCAGPSPVITFQVAAVSPSIFPYGAGAAIVNLSGGVNSSTNPAARGSYVSVFLTGIGPVTNQPATGALAPSSPLASASSSYSAQIGNTAATVQFLGLAPGFAGLAQANILIPTSISPGAQPLQITVGNSVSNTVQVYVQ